MTRTNTSGAGRTRDVKPAVGRHRGRPRPAPLFAPIEMHRTFEAVIDRIVDAIDARGLAEGDRLPNEGEMATMMKVSRPTLRQALRVLETSGVVTVKAGQSGGVFVASAMIPVNILGRNIALEVHHAAELIATRRLLEPLVYHLAAENALEEELDRISDTIALMETHIADPRMLERADRMFHRRVAHAAGNQILQRTMAGIYREIGPLRAALNYGESDGRHMIDVHSRQLGAIRARDHNLLEAVLQETFVDLEAEFKVDSPYRYRWSSAADTDGTARSPFRRRQKG